MLLCITLYICMCVYIYIYIHTILYHSASTIINHKDERKGDDYARVSWPGRFLPPLPDSLDEATPTAHPLRQERPGAGFPGCPLVLD